MSTLQDTKTDSGTVLNYRKSKTCDSQPDPGFSSVLQAITGKAGKISINSVGLIIAPEQHSFPELNWLHKSTFGIKRHHFLNIPPIQEKNIERRIEPTR